MEVILLKYICIMEVYLASVIVVYPDSKVHEANMGPIWGRQDPGGPLVGPMNFAIWVVADNPLLL